VSVWVFRLLLFTLVLGVTCALRSPPWVKGFNESEVKRVAEALVSTGMASKVSS
jgi:hypothetical protein